uniref:Uncharacterized protein n=1 Tax=Leishmania guyanensis TaxID=5670 RepID=A0A1E1IW09_LEIGU|nr:hypothetical protein, conserved [Leishmania guyanensis]
MQQRARATERALPTRDVRKVVSQSLSDSSDESALPMHVVSGGASRRVGRVSDDDYKASSYEETDTSDDWFSDNSEDYVPLAFDYINSNPRRHAGAPAYSKVPSGLEEVGEHESISFSDIPLEVYVERGRTHRHCGPGSKDSNHAEVTSLSSNDEYEDDISSTTSDALSVGFERRKRFHNVGKIKPRTHEASDAESSVFLSDEEEAPLNAQLIHTLIKRLRNPSDEVLLEAFDFVDFSDENFKEELEPLKQIRELLEKKASSPIATATKCDREVKKAVQSLPPEKAIAAKLKAIKSRQIRSSQSQSRLYTGGETEMEKAEAISDLVRRLKEPNTQVPLHVLDEVNRNSQSFDIVHALQTPIHAYMEAKEVLQQTLGENVMSTQSTLDDQIKTTIMSLPSEEAVAAAKRTVKSYTMPSSSSNGDAIRHLVARLKESDQSVEQCEFEKLDWNDRNFSRELEPLQQIRTCMEAKEALQQTSSENVMAIQSALEDQIKTAIMSLPPEKVTAVKTQILKMRERALAKAQGPQAVKVGKLSASAGTMKRLEDSVIMSNPKKKWKTKEGKLSASSCQVKQVDLGIISSQQPAYAAKESTALLAPAKKTRRIRRRCDRSVSISNVQDDTPPGEIVENDQELPESGESPLLEAGTTQRRLSHVPSRPAGMKKRERRPRNCRQGSNISFGSVPMEEPGVIQEEEDKLVGIKRKTRRRRAPHKLGRSLSMTSLPDLEAGEVFEEPTLPAGKSATPSNTRNVTPAPLAIDTKAKPRRLRPDPHGGSTQFGQPPSQVDGDLKDDKTAPQGKAHSVSQRKKRRARVNHNSRSCSFLEVVVEEAREVQDGNFTELKGAEPQHETLPPKRSKRLLRRCRPGGRGNGRALDYSEPEIGEADQLGDAQYFNAVPVKGRWANVHRTRSTHTSMIVELESGEIVERPDETQILYASSGGGTPPPDEANARRVNGRVIPAKAQKLSDRTCGLASTARRRRQRLHMSKELSVSAIPEDLAGEIVEKVPDLLAATAPVSGSFSNGRLPKAFEGPARLLPLLNGTERGPLRYADPPTSSLRLSKKSRSGVMMPRVDVSFILETMSNTPPPPFNTLRRSAEAASRGAMVAAKAPGGAQ